MMIVRVKSRKLAEAALAYVNRELVIPQKGTLSLAADRWGQSGWQLEFDGLAGYAVTRDKVENAVRDFEAGWDAACEEFGKQHKKLLKDS